MKIVFGSKSVPSKFLSRSMILVLVPLLAHAVALNISIYSKGKSPFAFSDFVVLIISFGYILLILLLRHRESIQPFLPLS